MIIRDWNDVLNNYFKNLNHRSRQRRILTLGTNLILTLRNLQNLKMRSLKNIQNLKMRDLKKPGGTLHGKISSYVWVIPQKYYRNHIMSIYGIVGWKPGGTLLGKISSYVWMILLKYYMNHIMSIYGIVRSKNIPLLVSKFRLFLELFNTFHS